MDNKFQIKNGTFLVGYEDSAASEKKWSEQSIQSIEDLDWAALRDNANFLLENASRIMSDSRMFLTPINVLNGMAYVGPLIRPLLGALVEMWLERAPEDGLVIHIAGSPLSGTNASQMVMPDGSLAYARRYHLLTLAKMFEEAHKPYKEVRKKYAAYSLIETVMRLKGEEPKYSDTVNSAVFRMNAQRLSDELEDERRKYEELKRRCQSWKDKYKRAESLRLEAERKLNEELGIRNEE